MKVLLPITLFMFLLGCNSPQRPYIDNTENSDTEENCYTEEEIERIRSLESMQNNDQVNFCGDSNHYQCRIIDYSETNEIVKETLLEGARIVDYIPTDESDSSCWHLEQDIIIEGYNVVEVLEATKNLCFNYLESSDRLEKNKILVYQKCESVE
jgi:hypothetical protein